MKKDFLTRFGIQLDDDFSLKFNKLIASATKGVNVFGNSFKKINYKPLLDVGNAIFSAQKDLIGANKSSVLGIMLTLLKGQKLSSNKESKDSNVLPLTKSMQSLKNEIDKLTKSTQSFNQIARSFGKSTGSYYSSGSTMPYSTFEKPSVSNGAKVLKEVVEDGGGKSAGLVGAVGLVAGVTAATFAATASLAASSSAYYADIEEQIARIAYNMKSSKQSASVFLKDLMQMKTHIPVEDVRSFAVYLSEGDDYLKSFLKTYKDINGQTQKPLAGSILRVAGVKNVSPYSVASYLSSYSKVFGLQDQGNRLNDLFGLSSSSIQSLSGMNVDQLQHLKRIGVSPEKIAPTVAFLDKFSDSAGSGFQKFSNIVQGLETNDQGALLLASLGVEGTKRMTEEYIRLLNENATNVRPQEFLSQLSETFYEGFNQIVAKNQGDYVKSITDVFSQSVLLAKEKNLMFSNEVFGQETLNFLKQISSENALKEYENMVQNFSRMKEMGKADASILDETLYSSIDESKKVSKAAFAEIGEMFSSITKSVLDVYSSTIRSFNGFMRESNLGEFSESYQWRPHSYALSNYDSVLDVNPSQMSSTSSNDVTVPINYNVTINANNATSSTIKAIENASLNAANTMRDVINNNQRLKYNQ